MELEVQKLLRSGISKEELLDIYGVHLKAEYNGKHSLTYDQLKAKDSSVVAQECRGLILRPQTWDIVAFPFKRFFNYGQETAAPIIWSNAEIQEKLDGTLVICYWDELQNQWCAATRAMSEAQGNGNFSFSFRKLIEMAALDMGFKSLQHLLNPAPKHFTLMFELTSPENKNVCSYYTRKLTLIGARDIITHQEFCPKDLAKELNIDVPNTWKFDCLETVIEAIQDWNPKDFEGVVVKDSNFNRIKIKSPKYLLLHHAINSLGCSWKAVVEAVAKGHSDDLDGMMPLFVQQRLDLAKEKISSILETIHNDWKELQHIIDQKEFAMAVKDKKHSSCLFALKNGKAVTPEDFISNARASHLVMMCGFKDEN